MIAGFARMAHRTPSPGPRNARPSPLIVSRGRALSHEEELRRLDSRSLRRALVLWVASSAVLFLFTPASRGEPTRALGVSGPAEVLEGDPETAGVDAHGQITMGPQVVELARVSERAIVSMLSGPDGVLYAGTAGGGLVRVTPGGESKVIAPADELVVSALAIHEGRLLAGTGPNGRVLSVDDNGKTTTIFDPDAKYIWSILEDGPDLLVATGEPGLVVRVTPKGSLPSPFDPGEAHIRSLIRHPKRGVIAGGGQKGIVYQLKGSGAFALYDSEMDEVTAFAVDPRTGDLFAAFVSETKPGSLDPEKSIGAVAGDPPDSDVSPIKGSDVVRIADNGRVDLLWSSKREGALGLAFDERTRRLYIATGTSMKGRGRIYAVETGDRDRLLLAARVEPPLASALLLAPRGGALLVGTAPTGQVLRLGPGPRSESTYLSAEQDLARSANVGRVWFDADVPRGARVDLAIRTGNTREHDKTWSEWSQEVAVADGGEVNVPEGRYAQFRVRLRASPEGRAPVVKSIHASVVRMNVAPTVHEVFLLRRGVYMAKMPREEEKEKTITLGKSVIASLRQTEEDEEQQAIRVRQGVRPGTLTVAWRAEDPNGDALLYRVEIRRLDDPGELWSVLADNLADDFFSFDSRAHPDGRYQFRISASDRPSNPPHRALSDRNVSEPIVIDNGPPKIKNLHASSPSSGRLRVEAEAEDATSNLEVAEFAVNGGPWLMLPASDGFIDARSEKLSVDVGPPGVLGAPDVKQGRHTVLVRVEDEAGNASTASTTLNVR